ncbi:MAG: hypothetical protein NTW87_11835 [Planctomycetota bacterium]|nr:hypothetical protein [Planctomycetota bacterium]
MHDDECRKEARDTLRAGQSAFKAGRINEAQAQFADVVSRHDKGADPKDVAEAALKAGSLFLLDGDILRARESFTFAVQAAGSASLGTDVALQLRDFCDAALAAPCGDTRERAVEALYRRGRVLTNCGLAKLGLQEADRIAAIGTPTACPRAALLRSHIALKTQDHSNAEKFAEEALQLLPSISDDDLLRSPSLCEVFLEVVEHRLAVCRQLGDESRPIQIMSWAWPLVAALRERVTITAQTGATPAHDAYSLGAMIDEFIAAHPQDATNVPRERATFYGVHSVRIGRKGIALPKPFQRCLREAGEQAVIVVQIPGEDFARIFPATTFAKALAEIKRNPHITAETMQLIAARAHTIRVDSRGRFIVPPETVAALALRANSATFEGAFGWIKVAGRQPAVDGNTQEQTR